MGHGKLRKFAENETFACLLQPDASAVLDRREGSKALHLHDHPVKGNWNRTMFAAPQPIVLELGCGKGDYTIALARRHPEYNFIGVDIKGARLWKGAKEATESALPNVAFLRTRIEFIEAFFGPAEVAEIWLTFSDPQLKSENSRLTSPLFLERYRKFLAPGGIVHLKTDSRFLHEYTRAVLRTNGLAVLASGTDIYRSGISLVSPTASGTVQNGEVLASGTDIYRSGISLVSPTVSGTVQNGEVLASGTDIYRSGISPTATGMALEGESAPTPPDPIRPAGDAGTVKQVPEGSTDHVAPGRTVCKGEDMAGEAALPDLPAVFEVQTFYERMFLEMGLPITYLAFRIDHDGPYAAPADFDADSWRAAEGPRRTFSHHPAKKA